MPAYIDYFIYISLTKPYPDHSGIAEFVGAVALWQQSWFLRSLERLNQIIDQWSFTRYVKGFFCLLLSMPSPSVPCCLSLWQCLPSPLPKETAIISLLTPIWCKRSPAPFFSAASPSCCLVLHTLPEAGKRSRSRTAKRDAFYWNRWSRLSFYDRQSHLLLKMVSCPRQPPTMMNARHDILLEVFGKVFSKF